MTIDLKLAAYTTSKPTPTVKEIFARKRVHALSGNDSRARLELLAKIRQSTWRRHEHQNKQMQYFQDRERFQKNQTWQAEYDQLKSAYVPGLEPFIDDRVDKLKDMIVGRKLDKLEWQPMH